MFRRPISYFAVAAVALCVFVVFVVITAFALQPTEILIFTNVLLLVLIMVQLYTVSTLTDVYEQLEKVKVVKKR